MYLISDIKRVAVIDDDPAVRRTYKWLLDDVGLEYLEQAGPMRGIDTAINAVESSANAALCDHHLQKKNYADFDGAEAVSLLYRKNFPAILCTTYQHARMYEIRRYRRYIPVLLEPGELDTDSLMKGFETCIAEFKGKFHTARRPVRQLIRVENIELQPPGYIEVIIGGWNPTDVVRIPLDHLPPEAQSLVRLAGQRTIRFHAEVNLGAESQESLFFDKWEVG